jgi:predicted transcriptional regulator
MGGKPHCIKHIDQSPHAKRVIEAKTKRSKELSTATKPEGWRTIDVNGSRAREIIAKLKLMGAMSPSNLATQVELGKTTIEAYLVALEAAGLVKVEKLRSARYVTRRVVIAVEKDD